MRVEHRYKVTVETDTEQQAEDAAKLISDYMELIFTNADTVGWKVVSFKRVGKGKPQKDGILIVPAGSIGL
jgi:hypothetical protein